MSLTEREVARLNMMNPVTNDLKLGDLVKGLLEGGGEGTEGPQGPKGDPGQDGFGTEAQYNDIIARLEALETAEG